MSGKAKGSAWTRVVDIRERVQRLWDRGILLAETVEGAAEASGEDSEEGTFPLRLRLKIPKGRELAEKFSEVRAWVTELKTSADKGLFRLETALVNDRVLAQTSSLKPSYWTQGKTPCDSSENSAMPRPLRKSLP